MRWLIMSRFLSVYWYALSFEDYHQLSYSSENKKSKKKNEKDEQDQKDLVKTEVRNGRER